jgi:predicted ATPase/class 3 adenylate cyclase
MLGAGDNATMGKSGDVRGPSVPTGTVTFLFTDLEGSTRLWEEHPEPMKKAVAAHDEIVRRAIETHGGHLFSTGGDGFAAAFSRPEDALKAAVEAQGELGSYGWPEGCELWARMGVHSGTADERDGDYFGPAVNRADRVMAAGHSGQILVSLVTKELVRDQLPDKVALRDLGRHRLRDLSEAERLFQVGMDDFPPLRTLEAVANNLPAQLSSFVGRERELVRVGEVLEEHRLVTLTGVGGTGKTRLALQFAAEAFERFPDGVYLAELATVTEASLVAEQVATAVSARGVADVDGLVAFLSGQRVLLVLDNCEHLIGAMARMTERLMQGCPELCVVATSREALGVPGEQALPVPSLDLAPEAGDLGADELLACESARLLIDRVRSADPDFKVSGADAAVVGEICRRLDGIPLAIELAAARITSLSVGEVLRRLDDQFRLLTGGRRTAVERHQTLRAAIDWSYELLTGDARHLLPRLGVFRGGWTLEAAEAVCSDNMLEGFAVVDAISELVEKSMVVVDREGASRYRMVEPLRQYALERLVAAGEVEATRDRHAAWIEEGLAATSYQDWVARGNDLGALGAGIVEYPNAVEAMRWLLERGDADTATRISASTGFAAGLTGRYREAIELADAALAHDDVSCWARYQAQTFSGFYALILGDADGARARADEAAAVGRRCPGVGTYLTPLLRAGIALYFGTFGDLRELGEEVEVAREEAAAEGDQYGASNATFLLGIAAFFEGDYQRAVALFEEAYGPLRGIPLGFVPYAAAWIAFAKVAAGHEDVEAALEEAERVVGATSDPGAMGDLMLARAAAGPAERSRAAVEEGLGIMHRYEMGPRRLLAAAAYHAEHRDDPPRLARVLGALSTQVDDITGAAYWRTWLAWARERLGEDRFREHFEAGAREGAEAVIEELLDAPSPTTTARG